MNHECEFRPVTDKKPVESLDQMAQPMTDPEINVPVDIWKETKSDVSQNCHSCDDDIKPDEHSHECIRCRVTLCNFCFIASARCPTCED